MPTKEGVEKQRDAVQRNITRPLQAVHWGAETFTGGLRLERLRFG